MDRSTSPPSSSASDLESGTDTTPKQSLDSRKDSLSRLGEKPTKTTSPTQEGHTQEVLVQGNIFEQGGVSYRTMGRWDTYLLLTTNQFGLGILSLPSVLNVLGIVPSIFAIVGFGLLAWYSGHQLLSFYKKYPHVVNIVEAARVVGGRPFAAVVSGFMIILLAFYCASAVVTLSIAFNTISNGAICTVSFMAVAVIACYLINIPRTMKFVAWSGYPNNVSILAAALIVIISLGVGNPGNAPENWTRELKVVGTPTLRDAINACLRIIYSYAGNVSFLTYMAEMKSPEKDFGFCLAALEITSITLYCTVAIAVYCLAGQYTLSPALSTAPAIPAKAAYGLLIVALLATGLANGHTASKLIYVQVMRKMNALHQLTDSSVKSWSVWVSIVTVLWIAIFIIANVIPIFDSILAITGATAVPWLTFGFASIFWLYNNQGKYTESKKKMACAVLSVALVVFSVTMNGIGLWASVTELLDIFNDDSSSVRGVFSCGSNA